MLRVQDVYESVVTMAGQYLIPLHKIELKMAQFVPLVKQALSIYNRYCPFDTHIDIDASASREFRFEENTTPYGIPDNVVDLVPYASWDNLGNIFGFGAQNIGSSNVSVKQQRPFIYRKPILYVPITASYDAHCVFYHKVTTLPRDGGGHDEVILTLDETEMSEFCQLCLAKFLQALGRSRRAFTLNDLPIANDSSELASEGQTLEERIVQDLIDNKHKFYLCWS